MIQFIGVPTYQDFIDLVDEVTSPPNQGNGELDKYNQIAAGLLHLRTGASWCFLFFFLIVEKRSIIF
jgi:hypothetical protein